MHSPVRTQAEIFDKPIEPICDVTDMPDVTRQEFKQEADINWLMKRYVGGAGPVAQPQMFAEVDETIDLLSAQNAMMDARRAYETLPQVLRNALNFTGFLEALANGSLNATVIPPKQEVKDGA